MSTSLKPLTKTHKSAAHLKGSSDIIKENKVKVEEIKKSNALLAEELKTEKRHTQKSSQIVTSKISNLQDTAIVYAQRIEIESQKLKNLEQEIAQTEEILKTKKEQLRNIDGNQVGSLSKQIKQKENELDKKLQRYNEALAYNRQLRHQINNLRKERTLFDNIYNQLEVDILNKKNELLALIEESEKAEKTKEEYLAKLEIIKSQAEKEQEQFQKGYEQVLKSIKDESKYMRQEEQSRVNTDQETSKIIKNEENDGLKKGKSIAVVKSTLKATDKVVDPIDEATQKIEEYEDMLKKLTSLTQMDDIDDIINFNNTADSQNQELFSDVSKLTEEIEQIENEILSMEQEIEKYSKPLKPEDEKRLDQIKDLQEKIRLQNKASAVYQSQITGLQNTFSLLKMGIPQLMEKIGCKDLEYMRSLDPQINDQNILQYLTVIERRTNEVIDVYKALENKLEEEQKVDQTQKSKEGNNKELLANQHIDQINEFFTITHDIKNEEELIMNNIDTIRDQITQEVDKKLNDKNKKLTIKPERSKPKRVTVKYS